MYLKKNTKTQKSIDSGSQYRLSRQDKRYHILAKIQYNCVKSYKLDMYGLV